MTAHTRISSCMVLFTLWIVSACQPQQPQLQALTSPAGAGSHLPSLATDSTGAVFLSWAESGDESSLVRLLYSRLQDDGWSQPQPIATGRDWFVNWADYPTVISSGGQLRAAHTLKKIPGGTYAYNVNIYQPASDSGNWQPPMTPHADGTATEHGFASMVPLNDAILAVWLDGRQTADRSDEEYFDLDKAMTLRSAAIAPGGSVSEPKLIDDSVCDCCNTALAITSKGPLVAYRNRAEGEIRDIYTSRYDGSQWSTPAPVHRDEWNIAACPVNGPALAARGSQVTVAWYTAANDTPRVKAARSTTSGDTFGDPVVIDEGNPVGRIDAAMDRQGRTYISWIENTGDQHQVMIRRLLPDGTVSDPYAVTDISSARSSGFPQMVISGERLVLAWTHVDSAQSRVRTASLPAAALD